ncbi:MAG: class I SAM-dependent methyltransferase [Patescibacteria group bacterium]
MKSTSIHSLNADKGLNIFQKPAYLFLNLLNNLFPYSSLDKRIEIRSWKNADLTKEWDKTFKTSSVGRRLSDLFWRTLPWDKLHEELKEIHVFDTGCGQGNYSMRLSDGIASYTGVDMSRRPNWDILEKEHPNFHFIESSSTDILPLIPPETNLFITQSAIEHFDEDLRFFEQIRDYIGKTDRPIIQIHNFPARAILPLYLFHGIRQYTPRTVSKITRIFGDKSKFYLYGLGGRESKKIQFKYFTWPLLILKGKAAWSEDVPKYDSEVRRAIESDMKSPSKNPLFWVLIIHSNVKKEIW